MSQTKQDVQIKKMDTTCKKGFIIQEYGHLYRFMNYNDIRTEEG